VRGAPVRLRTTSAGIDRLVGSNLTGRLRLLDELAAVATDGATPRARAAGRLAAQGALVVVTGDRGGVPVAVSSSTRGHGGSVLVVRLGPHAPDLVPVPGVPQVAGTTGVGLVRNWNAELLR
jgi:hypothetical protein